MYYYFNFQLDFRLFIFEALQTVVISLWVRQDILPWTKRIFPFNVLIDSFNFFPPRRWGNISDQILSQTIFCESWQLVATARSLQCLWWRQRQLLFCRKIDNSWKEQFFVARNFFFTLFSQIYKYKYKFCFYALFFL
jgi:hypothetical protein